MSKIPGAPESTPGVLLELQLQDDPSRLRFISFRFKAYKAPVTPIAVPNAKRRERMWRAMDAYAKSKDPVLRSVCVSTISHSRHVVVGKR